MKPSIIAKNKNGDTLVFKTHEQYVFDNNGVPITSKLESIQEKIDNFSSSTTIANGPDLESTFISDVCSNGKGTTVTVGMMGDSWSVSRDNKTWTQAGLGVECNLPAVGLWPAVAYGNGKFVALGIDMDTGVGMSAISTDGTNWETYEIEPAIWMYIIYGNGIFVAMDEDGGMLAYSSDGITWGYMEVPSDFSGGKTLNFCNDRFMLIKGGVDSYAYSMNGIDWEINDLPIVENQSSYWNYLIYGNGKYIIFEDITNPYLTSVDGINWIVNDPIDPNGDMAFHSYQMAYGNGMFTILGYNDDDTYLVLYSADGINWNKSDLFINEKYLMMEMINLVFIDDKFIVTGAGMNMNEDTGEPIFDNIMLYSIDGITWNFGTAPTFPVPLLFVNVAYGEGKYVTTPVYGMDVANESMLPTNQYMTSTNGVDWVNVKAGEPMDTEFPWRVVYTGDRFFAFPRHPMFGDSQIMNTVLYSFDGSAWMPIEMPSERAWSDVIFVTDEGMSMYFFISADSTVWSVTPDFINWDELDLDLPVTWDSVMMADDLLVFYSMMGQTYVLFDMVGETIPDGMYIGESPSPLINLTYGNGRFISVVPFGENGENYFIHSNDGMNWEMGVLPTTEYSQASWVGSFFTGEKFIACGVSMSLDDEGNPSSYDANIHLLHSTDGLTWNIMDIGTLNLEEAEWLCLTHENGEIVTITSSGEVISVITGDSILNGIESTFTKIANSVEKTINGKQIIAESLNSKGVDVNSETPFSLMARAIDNLSDIYNETADGTVTSERMLEGYSTYVNGEKVEGSIPVITAEGVDDGKGYITTDELDVITLKEVKSSNPMPGVNDWRSITYGNGMFIAVSQDDKIARSRDGVKWEYGSIPEHLYPMSIAYGDGKFVVVSSGGADIGSSVDDDFIYSTDGINWVEGKMPSPRFWSVVTYGGGKFVAIGGNDTVAHSTDGITWVESTLPTPIELYWTSITYGGGKFVAIGIGSTTVYSEDGINWLSGTMPSASMWMSLTYGDGKFVALSGLSMVAYSTDGINWTQGETDSSGSYDWWSSVTYGNGKFVAVSAGERWSDKFTYSIDGINWTEISAPTGLNWTSITYGNGIFIAVADISDRFAYSEDGINWTLKYVNCTSNLAWSAVAYGNGKYVAITNQLDDYVIDMAASSTDGINWVRGELPNRTGWTSLAYGNGKFVAAGGKNYDFAYSEDGVEWKGVVTPDDVYLRMVTYGDDKFVAVTNGGTAYSIDGINWIETAVSLDITWGAMTYGNGKFVAVSGSTQTNGGKSAYSEDGINWNIGGKMPLDSIWESVAYGNGKFVAMTKEGNVAYGEDGTRWELTNLPLSNITWKSITYGNGVFMIVGYSSKYNGTTTEYLSRCMYSIDGINWEEISIPNTSKDQLLYSVTYGDNGFVVVGYVSESKLINISENLVVTTTPDSYLDNVDMIKTDISITKPDGYIGGNGYISLDASNINEVTSISAELSDELPGHADWTYVTHVKNGYVNRYLAFTDTDLYSYSDDGINWTSGKLPCSGVKSVAYDDQYRDIVALASDGKCCYSTNGISWISKPMPSPGNWSSIATNGNYYVAIDSAGNFAQFSYAGGNWTTGTLPTSENVSSWTSMAYGNDKFIAISAGGACAYSIDGLNWTLNETIPINLWTYITYGNGKFVAITGLGKASICSEDGITWTEGVLAAGNSMYSGLTYGNGKFVAIIDTGNDNGEPSMSYVYSEDGINWTTNSNLPNYEFMTSITYGNGKFIIVYSDGPTCFYSEDGINWNVSGNMGGNINDLPSITYGDGKFIAIPQRFRIVSDTILYSEDGINWNECKVPNGYWRHVAYGSGKFVSVYGINEGMYDGKYAKYNRFMYSEDGINWIEGELPIGRNWGVIFYGGGKFIILSYGMNTETYNDFLYSEDGINWNQGTLPKAAPYKSMAYGNGKFIAIWESGIPTDSYIYSDDGVVWFEGKFPSLNKWSSIAYGNGKFVISTTIYYGAIKCDGDVILTSSDGINWTEVKLASGGRWEHIAYESGYFIAFESGKNRVIYSEDGINWTELTTPTTKYWNSATGGNGKVLAVSDEMSQMLNINIDKFYTIDILNNTYLDGVNYIKINKLT